MAQSTSRQESDVQSVKEVIRKWREAVNAGDMDAIFQMVGEDLEMISPGEDPVRGTAALDEIRAFFDEFTVELKPFVNEEIIASGDSLFEMRCRENDLP
jgi:ketosteroid isomerase-like protein